MPPGSLALPPLPLRRRRCRQSAAAPAATAARRHRRRRRPVAARRGEAVTRRVLGHRAVGADRDHQRLGVDAARPQRAPSRSPRSCRRSASRSRRPDRSSPPGRRPRRGRRAPRCRSPSTARGRPRPPRCARRRGRARWRASPRPTTWSPAPGSRPPPTASSTVIAWAWAAGTLSRHSPVENRPIVALAAGRAEAVADLRGRSSSASPRWRTPTGRPESEPPTWARAVCPLIANWVGAWKRRSIGRSVAAPWMSSITTSAASPWP